jgi:hypothetical protein
MNEIAPNSKNMNIRELYRGINEFKRGYQPRNNFVKYKNGDLLVDSHNILNRWKKYFSKLLNVHVSEVNANFSRTESVAWSARRIPTAVISVF